MKELTLKDVSRFMRKVSVPDNEDLCWIWKSDVSKKGYGRFNLGGKAQHAHRVSYKIHTGDDPCEMHVLHSCDNPSCVNPNHLRKGTNKENHLEKVAKGRQRGNSLKGENAPNAKLTETQVLEIKGMLGKIPQSKIAKQFGVTQTAIMLISTGRTWKHLKNQS